MLKKWKCPKLGDIATVCMCRRIFSYQTSIIGEIPFYKIGTFGKEADAYISNQLYEEYKEKYPYPEKGDVLISAAGTLGRTVVFDGQPAYFQDSNIVWLKIDKDQICNEYLAQYYNVIKWASPEGSTISRLYNGIIYNTEILLPPLEEQKAIADALADVDSLISALQKLIEKKKAIKEGAMQELLTGKKRLPGFSGEWKELNFSESAKLKARIGWQGLTTAEYLPSGYAYLITGTDFYRGKVKWETCHFVDEKRYKQDLNIQIQKEDVLLTKDGTIGKVAYVSSISKPTTLNSGIFVIRPARSDSFVSHFIYYVLSSFLFDEFLAKLSAGSTINHLYQKDFVDFTFKAPIMLAEQQAIAQVLSDMDSEIERLEKKLAKYQQIKEGMMQELLTGRIRLCREENDG